MPNFVASTFVKIDGIEGESQDTTHKNEIQVLSLSFGVSNTGTWATAGGGGSKHSSFHDVSFTKFMDKASPKLFVACATGNHIAKAVIVMRKSGQTDQPQEYCKITLTDLLVSSYSVADAAEQDLPHENVTVNFAKIEFEYKPQNKDGGLGGAVIGGFDIKEGKKV